MAFIGELKVEHLLESDSKKWSTFPKSESKSDAPSEAGKISTKKVCQKVEPFFKRCVKKWRTFSKSASKSDTPTKKSGVSGDFSPN